MNKTKKFAPINFGWLASALRQTIITRFHCGQLVTLSTAVLLCLVTLQQADAQGEFQFQYDAPTNTSNNFPAHPTFDRNVQPADLLDRGQTNGEIQQASHNESPTALLGSAGNMISSLSSSLQQHWKDGQWKDKFGSYFQNFDIGRMLSSLALVLGGYFSLVWVSRHFGNNGKVPTEVLEILGQTPFGPKKQLQIVRLGSKLLLLLNGPEGTHPIGEITDPEEVEYLASLCQGRKTASAANVLRIAKATTSQNNAPTMDQASVASAIANAAPIAAAAATAATAANPALAANANHLAAILHSLNGQSGNAAVFEA